MGTIPPNPSPKVTRCVCLGREFAELVAMAQREGIGAEEVRRRTGCGGGCGLCAPYISAAVATGMTELPVMGAAELEALARRGKKNGPDA